MSYASQSQVGALQSNGDTPVSEPPELASRETPHMEVYEEISDLPTGKHFTFAFIAYEGSVGHHMTISRNVCALDVLQNVTFPHGFTCA